MSDMITVGELEAKLLEVFPLSDCMEWDNCGLLVGDPAAPVTGICLALDPTPAAIAETVECGANVLITHHPIMLEPLRQVVYTDEYEPGIVYQAIEQKVALIAFHTSLDRAPEAQQVLPRRMGLKYEGPLEVRETGGPGMGQIAHTTESMTLGELAVQVARAMGAMPRVWGDPAVRVERVAIATGSGTSLIPQALEAQAHVFVAGEIKYHAALEAVARGMCCIEIGHDISEEPLIEVVGEALGTLVDPESVTRLAPVRNWWTPRIDA